MDKPHYGLDEAARIRRIPAMLRAQASLPVPEAISTQ
jgi:hypothetical protein